MIISQSERGEKGSFAWTKIQPQVMACQEYYRTGESPKIPIVPYQVSIRYAITILGGIVLTFFLIFYFIYELVIKSSESLFYIEYRFVILFSGLSIVTTVIAYSQVISKGEQNICDNKTFDLFSLPHFFGHTFLTLLLYIFIPNIWITAFLSVLWSCLWEFGEKKSEIYWNNFACESNKNRYIDVLLAIISSLLAWFFIDPYGISLLLW